MFIVLAVTGFVLVTVIIKWLLKQREILKMISQIPGPTDTHPIIGDVATFYLPPDKLFSKFRELAAKYYPIYKYRYMHVPIVNIICPEDAEIILSTMKHSTKSVAYNCLKPWLGTGLLTSSGSKWQHRRKILTPSFHFNVLQQFLAIITEETDLLVEQLQKECNEPFTDIVPLITYFTLNTICQTAMGTRLDKSEKTSNNYVNAVFRIGEIIVTRVRVPWFTVDGPFTFTSMYWEQRRLLKILHGFSETVINMRKLNFRVADLETENKKRRLAMLDLLISAKNSGEPIDDEGIREEVDTFMFEGHDTTTACICFTLLALANHPDIQQKVVDELNQVLGDSKSPTMQELQNLQYLEQVIKESLRMCPSVPFIARVAEEDIHTSSGYTIPAGSAINVHIYDIHRNPQIYPEPDKFNPDRFSPASTQQRHPFAYIPFSAGPRNCIGQKFALLEVKTVVAAILRDFILEAVDASGDVTFVMHLVLKSEDGIRIKFRRR